MSHASPLLNTANGSFNTTIDTTALSANTASTNSTDNRSRNKSNLNLAQWMADKVNSGQFPGVAWVNKPEGIFCIPWKHHKRDDWTEADGLIYKEWAIYKRRFIEGKNEWNKWKLNLRCALSKRKDIQTLKDMDTDDCKFYKFESLPGSSSTSHTLQGSSSNLHVGSSEMSHSSPQLPVHQLADHAPPAEVPGEEVMSPPVQRDSENHGTHISSLEERMDEEGPYFDEELNGETTPLADSGSQYISEEHASSSDQSDQDQNNSILDNYPNSQREDIFNPDTICENAKMLLKEGRMPLLMPASRKWTNEGQVSLPHNIQWPPQGFLKMSPDKKLLETEYVCNKLAKKSNLGELSRRDLLDELFMLTLPGSSYPKAETPLQEARNRVYFTMKMVALGNDTSQQAFRLVSALLKNPRPSGFVGKLHDLLKNIPIRID